MYHVIFSNGFLTTDDYSLVPAGGGSGGGGGTGSTTLNRALVSVTLDDGYANQYANAAPILTKYGLPATYYIICNTLTDQPAYMTSTQVKSLYNAGNEIGSHTNSHPHMTTLSASQLDQELGGCQTTLQNLIGTSVPDFAIPYGEYNSTTIAAGAKYYNTQRTTDDGYNTKANFDRTHLKVQNVFDTTTVSQVQGWLAQAAQTKSWLILVYHEVATTPVFSGDGTYTTNPTTFDSMMAAVKNSGLPAVTVNQAVNEIGPQL
jgi:hypothetical protein